MHKKAEEFFRSNLVKKFCVTTICPECYKKMKKNEKKIDRTTKML